MDQSSHMYDPEVAAAAAAAAAAGCTAAQQTNALAALRLLRTYNQFLMPPVPDVPAVMNPLLAAVPPPCPPYCQHRPTTVPLPKMLSPSSCETEMRRRGEKRPIPAELKDDKYFERRRRNNQAAKKSRDARRMREDQIAWRACLLEQENASLRAHVVALRQETGALRQLLASGGDLTQGAALHDRYSAIVDKKGVTSDF